MKMNLNHLNVFMTAAEKLNLTETAKALFISQPAVSKTIKQLEEALQVRLFVRDKQKGIILTDVGKEVLVLARQMQSIENRIFQVASRESQLLSGKIKIGSFPAASTLLLPEAIDRFRAKYPHVQIELNEGVSDQIKEWVTDRTVELGSSRPLLRDLRIIAWFRITWWPSFRTIMSCRVQRLSTSEDTGMT